MNNCKFCKYWSHNKNKDDDKRNGALIFLGDMILLDEYSYVMYRYHDFDVDGIITVMKVPKEEASSYGVVVTNEDNIITKLYYNVNVLYCRTQIEGVHVAKEDRIF